MCNLLYRWRSCCRIELDNDTCPHTHAPLFHLARDSYSFDIVHWNHGNKTDIEDFNLKFIETTKLISFTNRLSTAFFHKAKRIFCRFCLLQNLLYLCLQTLKEFWVFPFRQSFEWGRVNANHNATRLPSLVHKKKTDNDSRLLKNSEGNRNGEWKFCRGTDADITLFLQVTKIRKISKIRKIFEAN